MEERDRRLLLDAAKLGRGGVWADLGAGTGVFTLCLSGVLGEAATIWAVDRDRAALAKLERAHRGAGARNGARLETLVSDYLAALELPPLDGVLMANSLHYGGEIGAALDRVVPLLKPGGALLVVEYETPHASPWVPHPVPFARFAAAAPGAGLTEPRLLARVPSQYHGEVYSALARRVGARAEPRGPRVL